MKDEIKEILNNADSSTKFKMVDEDGTEKEMNIAGVIEQLLNDNRNLLDYITNLQTIEQQYSAILSENVELENKITNLQEENKGLHTRIKTIKRRRKAQTAKMRKYREEITNKQNSIVDYKSRNEKAVEYIKFTSNLKYENEYVGLFIKDVCNNLLNILEGNKDE